MHILLFGGSGHLGSRLAQRFSADHEVTGVVRAEPAGHVPFTPLVVPEWVDRPFEVLERLGHDGLPGPVDAVIAAVGGWYAAEPVLSRGTELFDADYDSYLKSRYSACTISQSLATGGRELIHIALNGVASIEACAGSGAISVFGAAQEMLIRVAAAESESVRFRELKIVAPVAGDERNDLTGGAQTLTVGEVIAGIENILDRAHDHDIVTTISPGDLPGS